MDYQTSPQQAPQRRQPDETHGVLPTSENSADKLKTLRVKMPSLFIYYAMDSFETLH